MTRSRKSLPAALWLCLVALCCPFAAVAQQKTSNPAAHDWATQAVQKLFIHSDPEAARADAHRALTNLSNPPDATAHIDALFVEMEAAALEADTPAELEAALRLCALRNADADPRGAIAGARILDLAGNTSEFRPAVPRIRALIAAGSSQMNYLRAALIAAASDGVPGLSVVTLAHQSGLLTDWQVAGPFGRYASLAFDKSWPPEDDGLSRTQYDGHVTERFRFSDGTFALPDYLGGGGAFYAASQTTLPATGEWRVRVESVGSLELFVDGISVLRKDDRFRATPEVVRAPVRLRAGRHNVLVKFMPSGAPFRIAFLKPERPEKSSPVRINDAVECAYVSAANSYWAGDYGSAIERLTELRRTHDSAPVDFLLARAWSRAGDSGSEIKPLLHSALKLAPSALAATSDLAQQAMAERKFDEAYQDAYSITLSRPHFEPALRTMAAAAARLDLQSQAVRAYDSVVATHPSCALLRQAAEFFASISAFEQASAFDARLNGCAPGSLDFAQALADSGRHSEAATALQKIVADEPLNRNARELLIRELALAGDNFRARAAAHALLAIAPNSARFRQMAQRLRADDPTPQFSGQADTGFADAQQFYAPYRRDGLDIIRQTATRQFSGGPAVVLLNDRVAQIRPDGALAIYVHRITRVLDRDGIAQYGEVALPDGASILELRTVKRDGTITEPEFNQHKATISMPALAPGDAIDLEYVLRYPEGGIGDHEDAVQFTFGSFAAPILYSRFVVLSPPDTHLQLSPSGDVPSINVQADGDFLARIWERNDIQQTATEVSMPRQEVLPEVRVLPAENGWTDVRDFYRDALIRAARVGNRTMTTAGRIGGSTDEQRLRSAYRLVTSTVRMADVDYASGAWPTAENTFATGSGSRVIALLALGEAIGIRGDLVMTRDVGDEQTGIAPGAYPHPLVVFHLTQGATTRDIVLDPEHEGIGFGGVSPTIDRTSSVIVPLRLTNSTASVIAALPAPLLDEESTAEGDVQFDHDGNLTAHLTIRMGSARSAQLRSILGAIPPQGRKHFFEQLAARIFPGTSDATGEVRNEFDSDRLLTIVLDCRAPRFLDFTHATADLDQLVPALGLLKLYQASGLRRSPLFIDTPLFETTTFHVHLPETARFASLPPGMVERNEFGSYSITFRQLTPSSVDIRREFQVPVQIIQPGHFDAFSGFAGRIDRAERQRLTLNRTN